MTPKVVKGSKLAETELAIIDERKLKNKPGKDVISFDISSVTLNHPNGPFIIPKDKIKAFHIVKMREQNNRIRVLVEFDKSILPKDDKKGGKKDKGVDQRPEKKA